MVGKAGTGKVRPPGNLITQDIANGEGLCVIDPHGELAEGILEKDSEGADGRRYLFQPGRHGVPYRFQCFGTARPEYKHLAASGLMSIFTKIWSAFGRRVWNIF